MGIVTKIGDKGKTSLLTGQMVDKDSKRVEAFGVADELMAVLALARSFSKEPKLNKELYELQNKVSLIMAEVACDGKSKFVVPVSEADLSGLDNKIKILESKVDLKKQFVVFGDDILSSYLNLARVLIRKFERAIVGLYRSKKINKNLYVYINRLSDYMFLLSIVNRG